MFLFRSDKPNDPVSTFSVWLLRGLKDSMSVFNNIDSTFSVSLLRDTPLWNSWFGDKLIEF
jgi:hypothetical protein